MVYPGRFGRGMILQGIKLIDADSTNGSFQANPTLASGDAKVEKDGGASTNLGTLPSVAPASGTSVMVTLSDTEMEAANVVVNFIDQTATKEWADTFFIIDTQIGFERANKCQAGGSSTTAILDTGASANDDEYNKLCVHFYDRTTDEHHDAIITDYVGGTVTATFSPACPFTPDADVIYEIQARPANMVGIAGSAADEDDWTTEGVVTGTPSTTGCSITVTKDIPTGVLSKGGQQLRVKSIAGIPRGRVRIATNTRTSATEQALTFVTPVQSAFTVGDLAAIV